MAKQDITYYHTLGIAPNATDEQVRQAYLLHARQCHPDQNPSKAAQQKFAQINRAYTMLKTAPQRAAYNRTLQKKMTGATVPASTTHISAEEKEEPAVPRWKALLAALHEIFWPFSLKRGVDHG